MLRWWWPRKGWWWPRDRAFRAAVLSGACLWLAACTATSARLAGWYVTRQINGYLDLGGEQHDVLRARVDERLDVLRREELPRWLHLLRQTRDAMGRGTSEPELAELLAHYDALLDRAVDQLTPSIAEVLSGLSDAQIAHFEARMLEKHEETYEELQLPTAEQREKLDERTVEAIESITGELRDEQQRAILARMRTLPDERPIRYRVDKQRIAGFAKFLRGHPGAPAIDAELHRLWNTRYEVLGPGHDKTARRIEQRRVLLAIDQTLSGAQRAQAVENMNDRIRLARRFSLPASE
jgi:Family of unknown function (DUF6279)